MYFKLIWLHPMVLDGHMYQKVVTKHWFPSQFNHILRVCAFRGLSKSHPHGILFIDVEKFSEGEPPSPEIMSR